MIADEPLYQEWLAERGGARPALYAGVIGGVLGIAWLRNRRSAASQQQPRKEAVS